MRKTFVQMSLMILVMFLAGCCCHHCHAPPARAPAGDENQSTIDRLAAGIKTKICSPYDGDDVETFHVLDWELHLVANRESYYTFHYNQANPTEPQCLSLDSGKLCACDIKSHTVLLPIECSGGRLKDVMQVVFKRGTLIKNMAEACPER
jgi:hypothetical protein